MAACEKDVLARGWCKAHYARWRRAGDPKPARKFSTDERFWAKVDRSEECWTWTASCDRMGYGKFGVNGRTVGAHVYSFIAAHGPVPKGRDVGHVCHDADASCRGGVECFHRRCVNPSHLELQSRRENILAGRTMPAINAAKSHCPTCGSVYSVGNAARSKGGTLRVCIPCRRRKRNARYHRMKGH